MGADDHLIRAYLTSELVACIRAAIRRTRHQPPSGPVAGIPISHTSLTVGHLTIDPEARSVHLAGQPIQLSLKEFDRLYILVSNAGRVLSREAIIRHVRQRELGGDSSTRCTSNASARRSTADGHPDPIVTIRGLGYKIDRAESQLTVSRRQLNAGASTRPLCASRSSITTPWRLPSRTLGDVETGLVDGRFDGIAI